MGIEPTALCLGSQALLPALQARFQIYDTHICKGKQMVAKLPIGANVPQFSGNGAQLLRRPRAQPDENSAGMRN